MRPELPQIGRVGVVALVPDDWEPPWTVRHQVIRRLVRYFRTVWISPPPQWREAWLGNHPRRDSKVIEIADAPGLFVYRPGRWTPRVYRPPFAAALTERLRLYRAQRLLRSAGCARLVLYIWRPEFAPALDLMHYDLSCYHIDDEYTFSDVEQPIGSAEMLLLRRAGQVIINSPALIEKKGRMNPNTIQIPNGVDYGAYSTPAPEPVDLAAIPHPRIGHIGVIKKQMDLELLCTLAQRHHDWSIVLVGPVGVLGSQSETYHRLAAMPNVHPLGNKPLEQLPAYTQHLDVGMLCYRVDDYTKYIYPLKLHEYLASGLPVVGAPVRSLEEFRNVVALAMTPVEWGRAIEEALAAGKRDASRRRQRQSVASEYDWDRLVHRIATKFCERLGDDCYKDLTAVTQPG